jgi:hypothetical protein
MRANLLNNVHIDGVNRNGYGLYPGFDDSPDFVFQQKTIGAQAVNKIRKTLVD